MVAVIPLVGGLPGSEPESLTSSPVWSLHPLPFGRHRTRQVHPQVYERCEEAGGKTSWGIGLHKLN
jgi:hypothetical protein